MKLPLIIAVWSNFIAFQFVIIGPYALESIVLTDVDSQFGPLPFVHTPEVNSLIINNNLKFRALDKFININFRISRSVLTNVIGDFILPGDTQAVFIFYVCDFYCVVVYVMVFVLKKFYEVCLEV